MNSLVFLDNNIRVRRSRGTMDATEFTTPPTATSSKRKVDTTDRLMERAVSTIVTDEESQEIAKKSKKSLKTLRSVNTLPFVLRRSNSKISKTSYYLKYAQLSLLLHKETRIGRK